MTDLDTALRAEDEKFRDALREMNCLAAGNPRTMRPAIEIIESHIAAQTAERDALREILTELRMYRFMILHCPDTLLGRVDAALTGGSND